MFETMLVQGGEIPLLNRHLARLLKSAEALDMPPLCQESLARRCRQEAACLAGGQGVLRLTVTAGAAVRPWDDGGEASVFVQARPGRPYPEEAYPGGLSAVVSGIRRHHLSPASRHKTLNYLDSLLARREAVRRGADEALLLNGAGSLAEGATTNLFWWSDGRLCTPEVSCGALPGVARGIVLELARDVLGWTVAEGAYPPGALSGAEEAWLTNAVMGVMPLVAVDGRAVGNGRPGAYGAALREAYASFLRGLGGYDNLERMRG